MEDAFAGVSEIIPYFLLFREKIYVPPCSSPCPSTDVRKVRDGVYKLFLKLPSGFLMIYLENGRQHMEFISFFRIYLTL
ncbi:MAG: hypothetical protein IJ106_02650 [Parasporobacterium sp.]|nr:hypothetical protein [Parasporobacterium sp.]